MKFLKFLSGFILISAFAVNTALPQAAVKQSDHWVWRNCFTDQSQALISPGGNILAKVTFQLESGDELIPPTGVKKCSVHVFYQYKGHWFVAEDEEILVYDTGKATGMFHFKASKIAEEPMAGAMLGGI